MKSLEELYPDPAPHSYQINQAQSYLAKLYGSHEFVRLESTDDGRCDDCRKKRPRYHYGEQTVCLSCAYARRSAATGIARAA